MVAKEAGDPRIKFKHATDKEKFLHTAMVRLMDQSLPIIVTIRCNFDKSPSFDKQQDHREPTLECEEGCEEEAVPGEGAILGDSQAMPGTR